MNTKIRNFLLEEDGITALEYGILAAIVAAVIVAVFGSKLKTLFDDIFTHLTSAADTTVTP